jgi:hypothetical protein
MLSATQMPSCRLYSTPSVEKVVKPRAAHSDVDGTRNLKSRLAM